MPDRHTVEGWLSAAKAAFANLHDRCEWANALVHRELKPLLDPRVRNAGYYQTPDLEEEEHNALGIFVMNPTRFDTIQRQSGAKAEDAARDHKVWHAAIHAQINNGRVIDRRNAAGIVRHGFKVQRLGHRAVAEPDGEDREQALKDRGNVFYVDDADNLSSQWLERNDKMTMFAYETEVPYLDWAEYKQPAKGAEEQAAYGKFKMPSLSIEGRLVWVGDDTSKREPSTWDRTLTHTIVEYLDREHPCPVCDDKHPLWSGIEFLRGPSDKATDAEKIYEYTLPWKHFGSFRVCGGRLNALDKDPEKRYRAFHNALHVEAAVINWCETMLLTMANRDSRTERVYESLARAHPEVLTRLQAEGMDVSNMTVPLPDPDSNTIPITTGEILAWPTGLAEALERVTEAARIRFDKARVSPFLIGRNLEAVERGRASSNLQATQQARIPFDAPMSEMDTFIWYLHDDMDHAIRLWGHEEGQPGQKFYISTNGSESVKGRRSHVDAGEAVYLDAGKLSYQMDLVIETGVKTIQERQLELQEAITLYDRGWLDDERFLEAIGVSDTEHRMALLDKAQLRKQAQPAVLEARKQVVLTMTSVLAGVPPEMFGLAAPAPAAPAADLGGGLGSGPAPSVRLPAIESPGSGGTTGVQGEGITT